MADRNDRSRGPIQPNDDIEQGEAGRLPPLRKVTPRTAAPEVPGITASPQQGEQHARKGHAQSPRELTHNEPPKQRKGGPRR